METEFREDTEAGDRVVKFFKDYLRHNKGEWAGQPFELSEWQEHGVIRPIFSWKRQDGTRKVRTAWIEIPKKNGKSTLASGLAAYMLLADREMGAEVYCAACDRDQARIVFNAAKAMIKASPIADECKIHRDNISNERTGSFYRVLSSDYNTADGINAHGLIFDEIHRQKNRELWDVLEFSTAARRQPLKIIITTAGAYDPTSIYQELHDYAMKVRDGTIDDPSWFTYWRGAEEDDDWESEEVWYRANPELGRAKKLESMQEAYAKAKETPANQNNFKRLHLNIVTAQVTKWLDVPTDWDPCGEEYGEDKLHALNCYGGLDLSATTDLTSLNLVFPPCGSFDKYHTYSYFWLPEDNLRKLSQRDRVPYDEWKRLGWLRTTPGNVVDYSFIVAEIRDRLTELFNIQEIAYDPWNATQVANDLSDVVEMVECRQGFYSMNEPTKATERLILQRELVHNQNPILRWNMANMVVRSDPAGNVKPDKEKATQKIDGVVAMIMAIGRATVHYQAEGSSVYEGRGILTL